MSPLRVRREPAPDDGLFLVRGDELAAETLRRDAIRTYRRFGEYGVSSWVLRTKRTSTRWPAASSERSMS